MKISIITAVRNNVGTIAETFASIREQTHQEIEHIVIDGVSTDGTLEIIDQHRGQIAHFISALDRSPFEAMNKGLALATGDVVGFLNADDVFMSSHVVERIDEVLADHDLDACYADLIYVAAGDTDRVVRYWKSQPYHPGLFESGWMPAHPTFYVKRRVYEKFGGFNLSFERQGDFELALRLMAVRQIHTVYVPETWVRMRMGGMSNRSIIGIIKGNLEAYRIGRHHQLPVRPWFPLVKIWSRLPQFLFHASTRDDR
jgi:glycosyltransferase involved in cell wall biosynthesis